MGLVFVLWFVELVFVLCFVELVFILCFVEIVPGMVHSVVVLCYNERQETENLFVMAYLSKGVWI